MTNESDYTLRIAAELAQGGRIMSAKELSDKTGVTLRFALKILRKLCLAGIADSRKGAQGGYFLKKSQDEISIGELIETIEGQIHISNCSLIGYDCPRAHGETECPFHRYFCGFTARIRDELYGVRLSTVFDEEGRVME